jgi:hypothetical protein
LLGVLLSGVLGLASVAATARGVFVGDSASAELHAAVQPVVAAIPNDAGTRAKLESRPLFVPHALTPGPAIASRVARVHTVRAGTTEAKRNTSPQPPTRRRYAKACHRDDGDPPA